MVTRSITYYFSNVKRWLQILILIGKKQIKEIAEELLIADIKKYISEHLDEFEQFKEKVMKENVKNQNF